MTAAVIYHHGCTVSVRWRHPRTHAVGQFAGTVHTTHPSGRITVTIPVEGTCYRVTTDAANVRAA